MTEFSRELHLTQLPLAITQVTACRRRKKKIAFTNGCFDILHPGHINYLSAAGKLCDILIIGLNDDASIRRLKGAQRPVNPLAYRACMLAALRCVDMVVAFSEETPLNLINQLKPDLLIKGGDYRPEDIVGAREVRARGGEVIVIPFVAGHSTSEFIARIHAMRG